MPVAEHGGETSLIGGRGGGEELNNLLLNERGLQIHTSVAGTSQKQCPQDVSEGEGYSQNSR